MVQLVITRSGDEELIAPAVRYLEQHGIRRELIRRVQVDAPYGDVQLITVTLLVQPTEE